ncbi:hypothetical protein NLK61_24150 [Pseudomonas fuscovaginae UPB0736]|uniref:Uncharacterized protein n=1 Tax=Pseudomonas asplenii TaxID=53407 RepID=A0A1H6PCN1_9PSED|nr:hypothetical protein [Pseudomonas fuscovaginae]UUQ64279.1 hypothetical protein NLK61_24150 [Pseudomonas fuscovaginae UPB0736]SEI22650.1 hypothetical protein SAMN05216581_4878 [Pseudomonas fuscovaginae]
MSLILTVALLVLGWLAVAAAMLWGVLRISRRHHHHPAMPSHKAGKTVGRTANAH